VTALQERGVAFGIGLLLGVLVRRTNRDCADPPN